MRTTKTSELIGPALDWAVARALGKQIQFRLEDTWVILVGGETGTIPKYCNPTSNWKQSGPIIEREGISTHRCFNKAVWFSTINGLDYTLFGPTPLIAAMRCLVSSKLGNEIDIPEGLL